MFHYLYHVRDESDEIEPPKYMLNRKKLKGELEEVILI